MDHQKECVPQLTFLSVKFDCDKRITIQRMSNPLNLIKNIRITEKLLYSLNIEAIILNFVRWDEIVIILLFFSEDRGICNFTGELFTLFTYNDKKLK